MIIIVVLILILLLILILILTLILILILLLILILILTIIIILILIIIVVIIIKIIILLISILILIIKQTYHRLSSFYTQSYRYSCKKRSCLFGITLLTSQVKDSRLNKIWLFWRMHRSIFNLLLFLLRHCELHHAKLVYIMQISLCQGH